MSTISKMETPTGQEETAILLEEYARRIATLQESLKQACHNPHSNDRVIMQEVDRLVKERDDLKRKLGNAEMLIEKLKEEVKELNFSVALHDRAAEKARALWAEAHPDEAEEWLRREDLMVWLMKRVERAEAVKESLTSALGQFVEAYYKGLIGAVPDMPPAFIYLGKQPPSPIVIRNLLEEMVMEAESALRTTEETNNDTHDRPVETLLLIKELGRMSKKLDALKGSLRNIADNAAHWDTGCGPDASAFGWIHDIAEAALRTAEESSVIDSTPAKQPEGMTKLDKALQNIAIAKRILVENSCPSEFGLKDCEYNPGTGCSSCCEDCWNEEVAE